MNNTWIIAWREFVERINTASFRWMLIVGPLTLLTLIYVMVKSSDKGKKKINAVVTDPSYLFTNRQILKGNSAVDYTIWDSDFTIETFKSNQNFEKYDAWIEINPKVLTNKVVKVFCREEITDDLKITLQLDIERRLEEAFVENNYMNISLQEFRQIKQPMNFDFINLYKSNEETESYEGYVGLLFGGLIVFFIAVFGMNIVRSTAKEKSNRIVEVILASVKSKDLMLGKIIGVGLAAIVQFILWTLITLLGFWILKMTLLPDVFDPMTWAQTSKEAAIQLGDQLAKTRENKFLEVIYHDINYTVMICNFLLLFILSYLFYGAFFSWIGAMSHSEMDGQQFTMPILGILFFSFFMGYIQIENPNSSYLMWFSYIPFTSATIQLVRIAQGYYMEVSSVQYIFSLVILCFSTYFFLLLASKLYKKNILNFSGHRSWKFWT